MSLYDDIKEIHSLSKEVLDIKIEDEHTVGDYNIYRVNYFDESKDRLFHYVVLKHCYRTGTCGIGMFTHNTGEKLSDRLVYGDTFFEPNLLIDGYEFLCVKGYVLCSHTSTGNILDIPLQDFINLDSDSMFQYCTMYTEFDMYCDIFQYCIDSDIRVHMDSTDIPHMISTLKGLKENIDAKRYE